MALLPTLINILAVLAVVIGALQGSPVIPPEWGDIIVLVLGIINLLLAFLRGRVPQLRALVG